MKVLIRCKLCDWETNNSNHMGIGHHETSHKDELNELLGTGYGIENIWMRLTFNPNTNQANWESFE